MEKTYHIRIRELREDHDLSQAKIAELLGTSQQMYSRYETGEHEMPILHLITLAKFYRVSADYILGLSNRK
ncbi:MAG: helix-turn-helix transcriptional regulator [Christensenella sp.]|uniref:helix-turn-helix domain-containing protein n=1 Tax=Christensenella sp. TaxID=1935934 RepID=UPI002B21FDDC|nr:helix-turn-helix transcriptional regulator [Christensenella sp.]MEA5002936.1 helix-turn-helix transcriptional regulator [Christensenella sp.]